MAVSSTKSDVCGADSTAQEGGVENIWQDALLLEQLAAVLCLCLALCGEVNVYPTGELVGFVPLGLSVSKKNELSVSHAYKHARFSVPMPVRFLPFGHFSLFLPAPATAFSEVLNLAGLSAAWKLAINSR